MGCHQALKVCHLISGDLWAGAEVQVCGLMTALATLPEIELSAIVLNEGKLADQLRKANIRVNVIAEARHGFLSIKSLIRRELEDHPADIVHSHRYKENILAGMIKQRSGVRYLVQTVHGLPESFAGLKGFKATLYGHVNNTATRRRFDRVIAVSDDIKTYLSRRYDATKVVTVHNAVDLNRIGATRAAETVRQELSLDSTQPIIGTVGRMVPVKGFEVFLAAAKAISQQIPQARFLMVGDGPNQADYEHMSRQLGLSERVTFLGFRHDVGDILNCLDLFVMTSHHEGVPTALLEAMALRRATVATAVGGITEVIEDNISGRLVPAGDVSAVTAACVELLSNDNLRKQVGEAARRRIESEFSVATQRDRVMAIYKELCQW
jgi:glycosyltransferase involved in cell wall biosynthesis